MFSCACTFINSHHFTCMISSCDCYVLKDIINNWSDEAAVNILTNVHNSMKPGSRLLVMERVMHTSDYEEERVSRVPFQIRALPLKDESGNGILIPGCMPQRV